LAAGRAWCVIGFRRGRAGAFWAPGHNPAGKLRATILCLAGSGLVAASLFYGVLANCDLAQTVTVIATKPSPDGSYVAVHVRKSCEALVGYCPSVTQVRVVRVGEDQRNGGTSVFQFREETDYLMFDWTSNKSLTIAYPGPEKVMYKERRTGDIDIQFLPVGSL